MEYIASASTDIGIVKKTNQDSAAVKGITVDGKKCVLGILCDGVGGLQMGEIASATMVRAFARWMTERMPYLAADGITEEVIKNEWAALISEYNDKIMAYGREHKASLGTTLAVLLLVDDKYYIVNIGDSRVYEIRESAVVLTRDQTIVERELELGNLTPEQAQIDPRRSILLQCIGVSDKVYPEFFGGERKQNSVYMLCSDGFRHEVTLEEIYEYFKPDNMKTTEQMKANELALIELNKQRQERDNISVVTIRTY